LTVQASVTEDVDRRDRGFINFTIEELRTLVRGINSATDQAGRDDRCAGDLEPAVRVSQSAEQKIQGHPRRSCRWRNRSTSVADRRIGPRRAASLARGKKAGGAQPDIGHERNPHADPDTAKRIKRLGDRR
jgi:twitching motility protein PilJ